MPSHSADGSLAVPFSRKKMHQATAYSSSLPSGLLRGSERTKSIKGNHRLWNAKTQIRLQIWSTPEQRMSRRRRKSCAEETGEAEWLLIRTGAHGNQPAAKPKQGLKANTLQFKTGIWDKLTSILNGFKRVLYSSTYPFLIFKQFGFIIN